MHSDDHDVRKDTLEKLLGEFDNRRDLYYEMDASLEKAKRIIDDQDERMRTFRGVVVTLATFAKSMGFEETLIRLTKILEEQKEREDAAQAAQEAE